MLLPTGAVAPGLAGLLLLLPAWACATAGPSPTEIPSGAWVGEGARATISSLGASLDLDCAGAAITPPLALDGDGGFDLAGWWERRAGPEPYRRSDARFRGHVRTGVMTIEITLVASSETLGPYELRLGGSGREPTRCR